MALTNLAIAAAPKNYLGFLNLQTDASGWSLARTTLSSLVPSATASAGTPFSSSAGGSAASGNLSVSANASSPLSGPHSLNLVSSAASVAGDMLISNAFTIDLEHQSKVLSFSFAYKAISGTMDFSGTSSNTFAVYIYDVTNGAWIQPAGVYNLIQGSGVGVCTGTFQTSSNGTQYQIAIVNINATSGAYSIYFDSVVFSSQVVQKGPAMSDWTPYTLAVTGSSSNPSFGTVVRNNAYWRRVGDAIQIRWEFAQSSAGSGGSGTYLLSLPAGVVIDTSKVTASTSSQLAVLGKASLSNTSSGLGQTTRFGHVLAYDSTRLCVYQNGSGGGNLNDSGALWGSANLDLAQSNIVASFVTDPIPVVGWSSNSVLSQDADTRVVALTASANAALSPGANNSLKYQLVTGDTHGAYSPVTGLYTCPVSGYYKISVSAYAGTGTQSDLTVYKNGANFTYLMSTISGNVVSGSTTVKCNAGDTLGVYCSGASTFSGAQNPALNTLSIDRVSGPVVVAATELVAASYGITSGASTSTGVQINYDTKLIDTHGAVTTGAGAWKFTAPVSGIYEVSATQYNASGGATSAALYKNGSPYAELGAVNTSNAFTLASILVKLNAGEFVDIRPGNTVTPQGFANSRYYNVINVKLLKS